MRAVAYGEQADPAALISDGSLEALKWVALVLMTFDHVNKYLLRGSAEWMFNAGRMAMPIFTVVLACNLARPGTLERGVYGRTMWRLAVIGLLASVPHVALARSLGMGWWPLNIMATLFVATAVMCLVDMGGPRSALWAGLMCGVGGALVEYWWPAIVLAVASQRYVTSRTWVALMVGVAAMIVLSPINGNVWALGSLVVIAMACQVDVNLPRVPWVFYVYYPAHLGAIWVASVLRPVTTGA